MKKIIKNTIIALILLVLPVCIFAKEDSALYEKLYNILGQDGHLEITSFKTLSAFDLDDYVPEEEDENPAYDIGFSRVVASYIYNLDSVKTFLKRYAEEHPVIDVYCLSYTNCGVGIRYDSDARGSCFDLDDEDFEEAEDWEYPTCNLKHYDVEIEVENNKNTEKYNLLKELLGTENVGNHMKYYLYDLGYINQFYNYHNGNDSLIDRMSANPTIIAKNFPEIKELLYNHNEFELKYAMYSNMGSGWDNVEYVTSADFVSFFDDTAYLLHTFEFHIAPVLFVSDTTEDEDLIDAAKARIDEYINNSNVKVTIDDVTPTLDEEGYEEVMNDLDNFLASISMGEHEEDTRVYSLKIGATLADNYFFIIRTSEENIKDLEVKNIEKQTGVISSTKGVSVPIDTSLLVDDVSENYISLNSSLLNAYDISLYSETKESYIQNIEEGLKVYLPVSNDYNPVNNKIVYLNNKGEVVESFDIEIAMINEKMYASFVTNHMSVYGIVDNTISINDIKDHYLNTNFMKQLLKEAKEKDPDANIEVVLDEENHTLSIISNDKVFGEEVVMVFHYNDEYISYEGIEPKSEEDESLSLAFSEMMNVQNIVYAILDTIGYNKKDIEIDDDVALDEEFFSEYGVMLTEGEFGYESESGPVSGTYIEELRISLDRTKIDSLVKDFGVKREGVDVEKPVLTIKKKSDTLVVSWEEDSSAIKFEVYRSEKKDGKYTKLATVKTNSYTDKKVKYGKTYYYKVKAIGEDSKSTSDIKSFKFVPAKVKNVKLSSIKSTSIKVNYDKEGATGYVIERSTDQKKWTVVKTITKNSTLSYTNTGLKSNKTYYYRVRAYKTASGKKVYGKYSDVVSAKTAPAKPKFTVKAATPQSLKLTITEVKGSVRYEVYRSTSKTGTYSKITDLEKLKYTDNELTYNKTYYYKVKACNSNNKCSDYSSVVSAKVTLAKPKIELESGKTIPMTVVVSNNKETEGYEIYRSDKKNGTYKKIATIEGDETLRYEDTTAKYNKAYYYKVRTFITVKDKKVYSSYSDAKGLVCYYKKPAATNETPETP